MGQQTIDPQDGFGTGWAPRSLPDDWRLDPPGHGKQKTNRASYFLFIYYCDGRLIIILNCSTSELTVLRASDAHKCEHPNVYTIKTGKRWHEAETSPAAAELIIFSQLPTHWPSKTLSATRDCGMVLKLGSIGGSGRAPRRPLRPPADQGSISCGAQLHTSTSSTVLQGSL